MLCGDQKRPRKCIKYHDKEKDHGYAVDDE
jgi:hypothetical protein